ncbi:hypothetical protein GHK68_09375 [Sinorhizobium meliloti]|nr:hypothetical protein [Sinorhizobium meliloti]
MPSKTQSNSPGATVKRKADLGMRFRGIFRSRDPDKLDSWIDDADVSGLVAS